MLESLGLTATAEAVYRAMLSHRSWGVQQIAEHLALTKTQVKAALDQLAELALLIPAGAPGSGWSPVHPAVGLSALLAQAEAEVIERRQQIDATRAAIAALSVVPASSDEQESQQRLEGVEAVRARMVELSETVTRECVSLNPNVAQTPDAKEASKPLNEQMLERGVAIRCIYQESFRNEPKLLGYARWLTELGGQARTVPIVPMLMVVYDRSTVLLPIDPADTKAGALEIRSPGIVAVAYALFEELWADAVPFGQSAARDEEGLDPVQRQLLQLLAAGHTDELAARRLGVSLSTVRRSMAVLMDRLDARSRFQAGIHAAQRGWLNA